MTHDPQRVSLVRNFLAVAATSSPLRNDGARQTSAAIAAKRVIPVSRVDAARSQPADTRAARHSGPHSIHARPPHTSLIDAEWDQPPEVPLAQKSGEHQLDAQPSLIDAEWDLREPGIANGLGRAVAIARPPQTSLIDADWESPSEPRDNGQTNAPRFLFRSKQPTLVDKDEELDPVITYFELDGPESLFDGLFE